MEHSLWWNVLMDENLGSEGHASHDHAESFEERCDIASGTRVYDRSVQTLSVREGSFLTRHT